MGAIALCFAMASLAIAQNTQPSPTTQTTTTVTTQTTTATQNPDGSWTVIEYPPDREVMVNLTPTTLVPGATGRATVIRRGAETTVNLDLSGLTGDVTSYNLYAVDHMGRVSLLGPVTITDGAARQTFRTPLDKFMIVLSPEANLSSIAATTPVVLRSAVPQGMAVVPVAHSGPQDGAPIGERIAARTTSGTTPAYNVPMLNVPGFRQGTDTHMRVRFSGPLAGVRANVFIKPRMDGATQIKMRFHEMRRAPANTRFVLWAVSPDNQYVRLGQVINTGRRNEALIDTETALRDFGLFVTIEATESGTTPSGEIISTFTRGR